MTLHGETLKRSNLVDLVNDILRKRKSHPPSGWEAFATLLRQTNVPRELVGHPDRRRYIDDNGIRDLIDLDTDLPNPVLFTPRMPSDKTNRNVALSSIQRRKTIEGGSNIPGDVPEIESSHQTTPFGTGPFTLSKSRKHGRGKKNTRDRSRKLAKVRKLEWETL
jgi:hypothetical protein